ncbi:MAG: TonB-dependent receptor [Bacteroidetes bacterium]|nr:TonB-dependent receptor [Bacteroidota bacterium]
MKVRFSFFSILVVVLFFSVLATAQQGKITGKVISSKTGEALIGATITIDDQNKSVQTDLNGIYSIGGLKQGSYNLSASFVSYTTKKIPGVEVKIGEATNLDIVLDPKGTLSEVVIKAAPTNAKPKETVSSLLIAQKNSASVSDGISAETIKRTPDRNTGDILKRVSGASLQEDKFAIVRGLNDRYNAAYLNGAPLPSSESDRKAFAFDIFPSNMLDNLVIYKTATPDMPGEFAGGQIVINTKGIPSENFQSFSFGMGANTIATFQHKKIYERGWLDNIGIDRLRSIDPRVPGVNEFKDLPMDQRIRYARSFRQKNWGLQNDIASPNLSFQYVVGRNIQRKNKDFIGTIFSVTYSKNHSRNFGDRVFFAPEYENAAQRVYKEETFSTQILLGVIGNISVKFNNNHNLSFKNIFSINSDDRVITRQGQDDIINEKNVFTRSHALWFTGNQIFSSQLIGEHYFPGSKIKFNWVGSFSNIRRDVPALRRMVYDSVAGSSSYLAKLLEPNPVDNDNTAGLVFYSVTKERVNNIKGDISRSFKFSDFFQSTFKAGLYYQTRSRSFNPRLLAFANYSTASFNRSLLSLTPDVIFASENMGRFRNGQSGFALKDITEIRDIYSASTTLSAAYFMTDQRWGKRLRLIYGVRVEDFTQTLNADFNQFTFVRLNTRKIDWLPSLNVVYSLNTKQNLRLCYSKTLNRPEFRELAPFLFRDYTIRYAIFGDTSLKRASIENYDLRYEFYPGKAQVISVSGFYKKFTDPIELISATNQDRTLTYKNTPGAKLLGLELEVRTLLGGLFKSGEKSFLNKLIFFGNLTLLDSKVRLRVIDSNNYYFNRTRPMQGQSSYVINGGFTYQDDVRNFSSTLSLNRYGQRIFLASNGDATSEGILFEPNLWENGRTQLDFQVTKSFKNNRLEFRFNVKDILAQPLFFFEDNNNNGKFDKNEDPVRSVANFGRVISLQFNYKF